MTNQAKDCLSKERIRKADKILGEITNQKKEYKEFEDIKVFKIRGEAFIKYSDFRDLFEGSINARKELLQEQAKEIKKDVEVRVLWLLMPNSAFNKESWIKLWERYGVKEEELR